MANNLPDCRVVPAGDRLCRRQANCDPDCQARSRAALDRAKLRAVGAIADFVAGSRLFTVLPSIAVSRQLIDGSLKAYRIVTPRITRQLVVIHHPGQPMSVAATKLLEILRQELADASAQLQEHIIGPD
jgi:DNA-binding transcriptional LysR family regulator